MNRNPRRLPVPATAAARPHEPRVPKAPRQAMSRLPGPTSFDCTRPFLPWARAEETWMPRPRLFLRDDVTTFKALSPKQSLNRGSSRPEPQDHSATNKNQAEDRADAQGQ